MKILGVEFSSLPKSEGLQIVHKHDRQVMQHSIARLIDICQPGTDFVCEFKDRRITVKVEDL